MEAQARHERRAKDKKIKTFVKMLSFSAVGALGFFLIAFFIVVFGEDAEVEDVGVLIDERAIPAIEGVEQANLSGVRGNYVSGYIRRTVQDGIFRAGSVAELPSHDDNYFYYEAWFVLPGVTDYFSAGSFERRADGLYGLRFESEVESLPARYVEYSRVIITREPVNGDEFPSPAHIAEANF